MIDTHVTLARGQRAEGLRELQELLRPYSPGPVDGIWGPRTEAAVHSMRAAHGLPHGRGLSFEDVLEAAYMHNVEARAWLDRYGVDSLRMTALVARLKGQDTTGLSVNGHVAFVARAFASRRVHETSPNRGPWVDDIVRIGGGNPETRPHWCGYFTACCRRVAEWSLGVDLDYTTSGGAVRAWQRAGEHLRVDKPTIGAVYHRTRTADPVSRVELAREGKRVAGHTGVVVDVFDDGGFVGIGGNSSGAGHSDAGRGGRVAYEVLSPSGDASARNAFARVVGFTICAPRVAA